MALVKSGGCPVAMPFPLPMWPIPNPFNANNNDENNRSVRLDEGDRKAEEQKRIERRRTEEQAGQRTNNTKHTNTTQQTQQPQQTTTNHNKQPQQINHNKPHTRCKLLGGGGFKMAVRGGGVGWLPVLPRQPHHAVVVPCFGVAPVNQNQSREGSNQSA